MGIMNLARINFDSNYSTSQSHLLEDFYVPALSASIKYDRAAGYFSSSLIAIAPLAYSSFVSNKGSLRLICSPYVSESDALRLEPSATGQLGSASTLTNDIEKLIQADDLAAALTKVMSGLLSEKILQIKFARPISNSGLFHDKVGIFRDEDNNRLSFVGSANETASAWSGYANHEQIETFCSWMNVEQDQRSSRHLNDFDEMWENLRVGLRVESASASAAIITQAVGTVDLDSSLDDVRRLLASKRYVRETKKGTSKPYDAAEKRQLRNHQVQVLESWELNNFKGLVQFATGGGKTLVGIEAVRGWISSGRSALVLVPSELLFNQWREEIQSEMGDVPLVLAGAGHSKQDWLKILSSATADDAQLGPRIVLATYQTAITPDFLTKLRVHENLLVVADEVHRMGAPDTRILFGLKAGGRLGLSATPDRYGDEIGTRLIHEYFVNNLEPAFTLNDAIRSNVLVPYDYYLESVELTEDESDEWSTISAAMAKEMAINEGRQTDRFVALARQRARILKRAQAKAGLARRILDEHYKPGNHWLIYCESKQHLAEVREMLEGGPWPLLEYHSGNSHRSSEIFQHFQKGGVLLAIKCLDEGVDIPAIDSALILASTSNPREFVQRRGRILRRSPSKFSARLFDVVVLGDDKRLLAGTEAFRALEFAGGARNVSGRTKLELLVSGTDQEQILSAPAFESADLGDDENE